MQITVKGPQQPASRLVPEIIRSVNVRNFMSLLFKHICALAKAKDWTIRKARICFSAKAALSLCRIAPRQAIGTVQLCRQGVKITAHLSVEYPYLELCFHLRILGLLLIKRKDNFTTVLQAFLLLNCLLPNIPTTNLYDMLHEGVLVAQDKNIKISVDNRPVFGVITRKKMRLEE